MIGAMYVDNVGTLGLHASPCTRLTPVSLGMTRTDWQRCYRVITVSLGHCDRYTSFD